MPIEAIPSRTRLKHADDGGDVTTDEWSIAALAAPARTEVLVVASSAVAPALRRHLEDRGCSVTVAPVPPDPATGERGFGAAILGDGFGQLADPVETLRRLASCLGEGGRVIVVADNAAFAAAPIDHLRAKSVPDDGEIPPRLYDLVALERVVSRAGLVVVDRLRVMASQELLGDEEQEPGFDVKVHGPEGKTRRFVLVAEPSSRATAATAPTLAERLQAALERAREEIRDSEAGRTKSERVSEELSEELQRAEAAASAARTEADDVRVDLRAREEALCERVEEVEQLHTERRHLELDLAVKDNYISELRGTILAVRAEIDDLQALHDDLLRSRHYKAALLVHDALRRVPLLHKVVQVGAKILMPAVRRMRQPQPQFPR